MRKFLSLIFALFVTLPFCTKCYAIEVDSLDDEVRHVVRQSVPANIEPWSLRCPLRCSR